jgi:hypothetical protein
MWFCQVMSDHARLSQVNSGCHARSGLVKFISDSVRSGHVNLRYFRLLHVNSYYVFSSG